MPFIYGKKVNFFNFDYCLAAAPAPSRSQDKPAKKAKIRPFGRLVLCLQGVSKALALCLPGNRDFAIFIFYGIGCILFEFYAYFCSGLSGEKDVFLQLFIFLKS
jgi:hypothetical protein